MNALNSLLQCTGQWQGENRLYLSTDDPGEVSTSTVSFTGLLANTFVRIDQTWAYQGSPQAGSFLIGFEPKFSRVSAHWVDTFHTGRKVIAFTGAPREDQMIEVLGAYAAPPGPGWGWRIQIGLKPAGQLEIRMFNITPEGKEELAVLATYGRA